MKKTEAEGRQRITVSMPRIYIKALDKLSVDLANKKGRFTSRSEALRVMMDYYIKDHEPKKRE